MKNLATLFTIFQNHIWEGGNHYDTWHDANETAKIMGATITPQPNDWNLATFPDQSTCAIDPTGAGVAEHDALEAA